ncbi:putative aldouronate transport system permease protein [Paenibacillus taihuensis]|uniref:Putative aldouronate transport system permease protein n=1 Tax=Paenibacillus taihuensis TaxID=1156355 RepID=A0A3D9RWK8_9BACL|nr:ABC transporter permease subunit [Paenibacillus taihuensis]REE81012.1 putative aldouronate transport system permease protein [Paenibacillus taihuensis]
MNHVPSGLVPGAPRAQQQSSAWRKIKKQKILLLFCVPFAVWAAIFCYAPIWGWIMAFQDYNAGKGIMGSPWVGLKHFRTFFQEEMLYTLLRNTIAISVLNIVVGTIGAVSLALLLNEVKGVFFKRTVQTISYLPYFISYVVVANLFLTLLSPTDGTVNRILMKLGLIDEPIFFFGEPHLFWFLVVFINVWKSIGWDAIIYIAAMSAVDTELYDAASVDGAGRWRKMWHITLPCIRPTIVVLLILSTSGILSAGFDPSYLLGNPMVYEYSEVIDTYVYRMGLGNAMYSYATAIGLFRLIVSLILLYLVNRIAKKLGEENVL